MARLVALVLVLCLVESLTAAESKQGMDHIDVSSLKSTLESGGAEELARVLSTMQAARSASGNHDKEYHIKRNSRGAAIYDFIDPTTATTTTTTIKVAAVAPSPLAKHPNAQSLLDKGRKGVPSQEINGIIPVAVTETEDARRPQRPAFVPGAGPVQGADQLQALTRGLETIRERIDTLAEEAVAAVQGRTMELPQGGTPGGLLQTQASAQAKGSQSSESSAASANMEQELQALSKRMLTVEKENKEFQQRIVGQAKDLHKVREAEEKDEKIIATLVAENAVLKENVTRISHRHTTKHLRKGAKANKAQV